MDEESKAVVKRLEEMERYLEVSACKLSAVSFALSHDASVPNASDIWGMSYIVDDVRKELQTMAKGGA